MMELVVDWLVTLLKIRIPLNNMLGYMKMVEAHFADWIGCGGFESILKH